MIIEIAQSTYSFKLLTSLCTVVDGLASEGFIPLRPSIRVSAFFIALLSRGFSISYSFLAKPLYLVAEMEEER